MTTTHTTISPTTPAVAAFDSGTLLTDGGLETVLIFHHGLDLPAFAAFPLLDSEVGREHLARYYRPFLQTAAETGLGFVLETPTWRANREWGATLGYDLDALDRVNRDAVAFLRGLATEVELSSVVVSGCVGPRADGYVPGERMTSSEAAAYHATQVASFVAGGADLVSAFTLSYVDEAIGVAAAAARAGIPAVISFTVETDGRLPSGEPLRDAVMRTDAATGSAPLHYMVNCAHPTHFADVLGAGGEWTERIRAVRANASRMSHAELDEAEELDDGDPADLARRCAALRGTLPRLAVIGGCCGTDVRHVAALAEAFDARRD